MGSKNRLTGLTLSDRLANLNYQRLQTDDIDELGEMFGDLDIELMQMRPGALGFSADLIALPGITITQFAAGQRMLAKERHTGANRAMVYILDAEEDCQWQGHSMRPADLLIYGRNQEQDYVVGKGYHSLVLGVDEDLAEDIGWSSEQNGVHAVPFGVLRQWHLACETIVKAAEHAGEELTDFERLRMRDMLLRNLPSVLLKARDLKETFSLDANGLGAFHTVRRAEAYVMNCGQCHLSAGELAKTLNMSKRTLFRSFQKWLGMGPAEYFTLLRLHYFRRSLFDHAHQRPSIARLAADAGFKHFGRLAKLYREQFGELPRDTVKRTRQETLVARVN